MLKNTIGNNSRDKKIYKIHKNRNNNKERH